MTHIHVITLWHRLAVFMNYRLVTNVLITIMMYYEYFVVLYFIHYVT